jgi:hypothetical protein
MKFFFPDSLDTVDPAYDFVEEAHSPHRVRHRTDVFAHEYLAASPYDGVLVSKALVEGYNGNHRYHSAQRLRLYRSGVRRFFRLEDTDLETMGDCGAYVYVREPAPPFEIEDVLDFYAHCQFDYVLSVDHVIPGFVGPAQQTSRTSNSAASKWKERWQLNLDLAERFRSAFLRYSLPAIPIGVLQGWDTASYVQAALSLEQMGYSYLAIGGMASIRTGDIMACIEAVQRAVRPSTRLHLLGISRPETLNQLHRWRVASFDSTMPLRQAFADDKHNYHTKNGAYLALRLPPVSGNSRLARLVRERRIAAHEVLDLERRALSATQQFEDGQVDISSVVQALYDYEQVYNGRDHREEYRRLLNDRPWEDCRCRACRELGIQIVIFRGRERNKRRGYHNLHVFAQKLSASFTEEMLSFSTS